MGVINLENIEAGMVLAADAKARNGRVLLPAGNALTGKHLQIFKAWGVTEADIEGVTRQDVAAAAAAESQVEPRLLERAQAILQERFRHVEDGHPFAEELRRLCLLRTVKKL
ncbi:MAG: hypothetical protein HYZ11_15075 [Candidatus Tectomicrobia bacterium]|uniref:Uncharacterized protein n=1 Tax=Tectimicrobiota bacterium TaxID=2528274 RepID=A0A932I083_UNCTE|nr:hypothetical protein [Candidatus Tectomicrobia bacterium]